VKREREMERSHASYVALGDSISIDKYTEVAGGGAVSQLARRLEVDAVDLTFDGNTTKGALDDLNRATCPDRADIVTLTVGGNDLLCGEEPKAILRRLDEIARRLEKMSDLVIVSTVYDPSDGDDSLRSALGLSRIETMVLRNRLNSVNRGIKDVATKYGFVLADLTELFRGHGLASPEPWYIKVIEPNLAGATAIAEHWYELLVARPAPVPC